MKRKWITVLTAALAFSAVSVNAEEVTGSWDENNKRHLLRRPVPTAISIYTDRNGNDIFHEHGVIDGKRYDCLRVIPSEHTFLQVDYRETPVFLNELKDESLLESGWKYAGGINAGYFSNNEEEYGRPVGAVRRNNAWTVWGTEENTPAYGSGYATAYFDGSSMTLRYHGWYQGQWWGDDLWDWEGYHIDDQNGITGAYTYFVNGEEIDITAETEPAVDYRGYGRALTIFAQNGNREYLLINIYGTVTEESVIELLKSWNTVNAIRLDGGGSCQMVYETELVEEVSPETVRAKRSKAVGRISILNYKIPVHSFPSEDSPVTGNATPHEQHYVYSTIEQNGTIWYRIGINRWIAGAGDTVRYEQTNQFSKFISSGNILN